MVNVNDIKNYVDYQLNKSQSGNTLSPSEFNTCLQWANLEYMKQRYGLPEEYQAGRPVPRIALDITQKIMDDMRVLRTAKGGKNYPAMSIDVNGWADYPADFIHVSSIRYGTKDVEILRDDFLADRLDNSIKYPTKENPICVFYDNYIEFHPKDLGFVNFTYIRLPETPVWAYTLVNDEPVYNSVASVQFEYPQDCLPDIAAMIVNYASNNLRDSFSQQFSQQRKDKGI